MYTRYRLDLNSRCTSCIHYDSASLIHPDLSVCDKPAEVTKHSTNRSLTTTSNMSIDPSSVKFTSEPTSKPDSADTPVKRGRGRPRKSIVDSNASTSPKRKRGRPTKGSDGDQDSLIKKKKTIDVPMEFEGTTFSVDVSEVLTRLDYHTFSKPLRHCFLGIVRDVVEITRKERSNQLSNLTVDPTLLSEDTHSLLVPDDTANHTRMH
ncbi:uncharacterized protein MELLADRAFT_61432 [Melampsora larici-populina 98AG31]|uniref:Uncharacterized protein n=1 Tax=Melampsora larici-populina (strain 98AG31 / pathotype 3-4-7) TaxID=747676 RepID=F4REW1_MELLP|nr:uncharacterized protein MELLADRAFT_61432 [Melampsora larici-populina 98AG31]EGG09217.1 hypothetical protein MELLADRAFT_61432 [Melampsora larici-populina 98AG31]